MACAKRGEVAYLDNFCYMPIDNDCEVLARLRRIWNNHYRLDLDDVF